MILLCLTGTGSSETLKSYSIAADKIVGIVQVHLLFKSVVIQALFEEEGIPHIHSGKEDQKGNENHNEDRRGLCVVYPAVRSCR